MNLREKKQKRKKKIIYVAASIFFFSLVFTPFFTYFYSSLESFFIKSYINSADLKKETKDIVSNFFLRKKIIEENKKLKERVSLLEVDNLRVDYLSSLLEKNNILDLNLNTKTAFLIKKNNEGVVTINKGNQDGLSVNDLVIAFDGSLVGRVSQVFSHSSYVDLFIKEDNNIDVILFPQNISLNLRGNGNALYVEINRDIEVNEGDFVYAQETPSLLVGRVSLIDFDPRDPIKILYISPIHGLQTLQEVNVLIKK